MKKIIAGCIIATIIFSACKEKVDPVDSNNATINLVSGGPNFVTGNVTVNPKDSLIFSFTITSDKDMKYISIQKNPVNQTAFLVRDTLTENTKHSYTVTKRLRADSINGDWVYRIVAHDIGGVYIGHKDVIVTVKADFDYFTNRFLRVPDTVAKTNTTYISATTGALYSYTTGAANSALIDFGMYYDTTGTGTTVTTDDIKFSVYALSSAQPQLSYYDISTWTKNATIMKKGTSPSFASLTSGNAIRAGGASNLASGTGPKATALAGGNMVYFKTAGGKYGVMLVNFVSGSGPAKESYINVDVKIEK